MSTPHTCPVCNGAGRRAHYPPLGWPEENGPYWVKCEACKGGGTVWDMKPTLEFDGDSDTPKQTFVTTKFTVESETQR